MNSINPEENQNNPSGADEPEVNDLEDTRPRKVSSPEQPEESTPQAQPEESSIEDTNPVKVRRQEQAESAAASADEGASLADTRASFTSPAAAPAFDETIPPPPGLDEPLAATLPPVESTGSEHAPAARPVRKPASGRPAGKPGSKPGGKPGQKKGAPAKGAAHQVRPQKSRSLSWLFIPVIGLAILLIIAGASAAGGYASGIQLRVKAAGTQSAQAATEQYQLGLESMQQGNFYLARQHFEYVIKLDPNFPGAADKLAEALLYLNATATPTQQPTPTVTPTPDVRAVEDLFSQAQQAIQNSDWDAAMTALLALRAKDTNYRPVDVDGMLFLALRNRGKDKIVKTDLEGGIYDLTLASNFAPLDTEAQALLTWSQMYITGASFWDLDWAQAVQYFSQIAPQMPNLMDSSKMTATERYRQALFEYGNQFARQGQWCKAVEQYQQSLSIGQNADVQAAFENAAGACQGGQPQGQETPKPGGKKNKPTPGP